MKSKNFLDKKKISSLYYRIYLKYYRKYQAYYIDIPINYKRNINKYINNKKNIFTKRRILSFYYPSSGFNKNDKNFDSMEL